MKKFDYKQVADNHYQKTEVPENLKSNLSEMIDSLAAESEKREETPAPSRFSYRYLIGAAASVAVIMFVSIILNNGQENPDIYAFEDTCATPEEAIEVIENTLNFISSSVNKANGIIESKTTPEIDLDCIIEKIIR